MSVFAPIFLFFRVL